MSDELQRAFDTLWSGSEARSWIKGRLGRVDTDGTIDIESGRPGFVYVRMGAEGDQGVALARNLGVPLKPYLPVRMRLEPNHGYLVIHGVDFGTSADTFDGSGGTAHTVGPHTHAIRSGLEYPIEALRFNPGRVVCNSALTATVKPFRYLDAGTWDTYTGGNIDLTSYLPASTKWAWILVGVDPATNTAVAAKSADQTLQTDLTASLIDTISFDGYIPCAAVQATSSDTSLTNIDRWSDAHGYLNMAHWMVEDIPDVLLTSLTDKNILIWNAASSKWINGPGTPATVDVPKSFEVYTDVKERLNEENIHGGFNALATAQPLDSGNPIAVTCGIGKIVISVIAGSDVAGSITITGTTVDRDTGVETPADTDSVTVDAVTTDASSTDSNGNVTHAFTGAYVTSKWFKGAIVLSTTDLTLTDVDVYQVAFEQFGDTSNITLDTLDVSALATNASAWCNVHLYSLEVTGDKCNITEEAEAYIDAADVSANKWYRLRSGAVAKSLDGATDGIWVDAFFGPLANIYWEDINTKVWYTQQITVVGNFAAPLTGVDYIDFDLTYADGTSEGRLQWNIDDGTLEFGLPGGTVNLQIGQEMVIRCRNTTGSTIANGSAVYITGASGNKPLIALADASDPTKIGVLGLATESIDNNSNGYVATNGLVRGLNTNGLGVASPVYLSESTPGAFTTTRPTAPDFTFVIGVVIADHASEGVIGIRPTAHDNMMTLSDVLFDATPADGEYLAYNLSNGRFELTAAPSGGVSDHGGLTGLGDDDHSIYALLAGRSGGQTLIGGTASGDDLTLQSTSHATKGEVIVSDVLTVAPILADSIIQTNDSDARLTFIADRTTGTDLAYLFRDSSANTLLGITAAGRVGIGQATPARKVHVYEAAADVFIRLESDDTNSNAWLEFVNDAQNWAIGVNAVDDFIIRDQTGGAGNVVSIDATSGEVGIGPINNPTARLHVYESTGVATIKIMTADTAQARLMLSSNTSVDWEIINDGTDFLWEYEASVVARMTNDTKFAIGNIDPDGTLHVYTASAGSVTAAVSADDLTVENSANAGISILTPNDALGSIFFGDPEDNDEGGIQFDHNSNNLVIFSGTGDLNVLPTGPYTNNDSFRIVTTKSPASGGTGTAGQIAWDSSYIYVCTATNTWKRAALTGGY
jgi:hypothetical protein